MVSVFISLKGFARDKELALFCVVLKGGGGGITEGETYY